MMKKISFASLLLAFCMGTWAQNINTTDEMAANDTIDADTITWEEEVKAGLNIMAEEARNACYTVGMSVYDLSADSSLFTFNDKKVLRPASTEKLLTAISALSILGGTHEYHTKAYYTGSIADSTLNGDIYVVGDMDPTYTYDKLCELAKYIQDQGIKSIKGKLYADISMKDSLLYGNGWCWDDEQPYLTPLSLGGDAYECKPTKINRYSPARNFLQALSRQLEAEHISTNGIGTATYRPTGNSKLICTIVHTVEDILMQMMKDSDNLYAESMFFQLAADQKKGIGWKDCAAQVENLLRKVGADTDNVSVADGSGLSLYNYVTPRTLVQVLRYAYLQPAIYTVLLPSLPVAGVDGTLERRMLRSPAQRNVRAKTGTCMGVITLAGYATAADGHHLAFAILCNGPMKGDAARALQDKICQELVR
jgi:D-alanyl-D-alanine carboxypeptidase/D-alanyl-D-alanine-endopeptidase (penicillin-binding protein 4)